MRAASYPLGTTSAGVVGRAALTDDGDLDPTRIADLALDRGGDLVRDQCRPLVVDLARVDHHPHLATGLHRIDLFHPGVTGGELLELTQASHVAFQGVAAGARPGARGNSLEGYVARLRELEQLASRHPGVEKVYAMQAGREMRVMVDPGEVDDERAALISHEIAAAVEREVSYPGRIKITVI